MHSFTVKNYHSFLLIQHKLHTVINCNYSLSLLILLSFCVFYLYLSDKLNVAIFI